MSAAFLSHAVKVRGNSRDRYMEPKKSERPNQKTLWGEQKPQTVYILEMQFTLLSICF